MVCENSLAAAVASLYGEDVRVIAKEPVYGGDINRAYRLLLSDGTYLFMKSNPSMGLPFFRAEAEGLGALARTGAIGTPTPLAIGTEGPGGEAFLLLEHLSAGPRIHGYWEVFGRELAAMHRSGTADLTPGGRFGFPADNYIGATVQKNDPRDSWVSFFRDCRLLPQIGLAGHYLDAGTRRRFDRLLDRLDEYLPEPAFPSLLHGDLWSGNAICGPDGKAWILDPAAYVGHFEAELAMTELFGGFPAAFYGAYAEVNPIDGGYRDRRDLYNLYHLLNHLNLFGASYLGAVQDILYRYT